MTIHFSNGVKKIIFSLIAVGFFALSGVAQAQMDVMTSRSSEVNSALQDIYNAQNIDSQERVDCSKVTDDQFDRLGDAYMGVMLPNEQQHEAMDNMMGGEGSESLRQAHINMGRSYLGCWSNYNSGPVYMPMMGGYGVYDGNYFSPNGMMSGWNMMGNHYGFAWFGWITMLLIWSLLVLGIVALTKWLRKK